MKHEGVLFETDYITVYPMRAFKIPRAASILRQLIGDWQDTWYVIETIEKVIMVSPNPSEAVMVARILDAVHRR